MSSFTQEAGRPRLSDTLSQRLTHTSVGTTKTGSKYRWAHAVPWSIAQNWDIQPKPVQDSVRTPTGSIYNRYRHKIDCGSIRMRSIQEIDANHRVEDMPGNLDARWFKP